MQQGRREGTVERERRLVLRDGLVEPSFFLQSPAQADVDTRPCRGRELDRPPPARDRVAGFVAVAVQVGQLLPEKRVMPVQINRLAVPRQRLVESPLAPERHAHVQVRQRQLGIEPERFEVRGAGLEHPVHDAKHVTHVVVQDRHVGLSQDRFFAEGERIIRAAEVQECQAEVGPRGQGIGVELEDAAEQRKRLFEPPLVAADKAERVEAFGKLGPQAQGRLAAAGGARQIAEVTIRVGHVHVHCGPVRAQHECPADQLDGPARIAPLRADDTQQVERDRVRWLGRQHVIEESRGLGERTGLLLFNRRRQLFGDGDRWRAVLRVG